MGDALEVAARRLASMAFVGKDARHETLVLLTPSSSSLETQKSTSGEDLPSFSLCTEAFLDGSVADRLGARLATLTTISELASSIGCTQEQAAKSVNRWIESESCSTAKEDRGTSLFFGGTVFGRDALLAFARDAGLHAREKGPLFPSDFLALHRDDLGLLSVDHVSSYIFSQACKLHPKVHVSHRNKSLFSSDRAARLLCSKCEAAAEPFVLGHGIKYEEDYVYTSAANEGEESEVLDLAWSQVESAIASSQRGELFKDAAVAWFVPSKFKDSIHRKFQADGFATYGAALGRFPVFRYASKFLPDLELVACSGLLATRPALLEWLSTVAREIDGARVGAIEAQYVLPHIAEAPGLNDQAGVLARTSDLLSCSALLGVNEHEGRFLATSSQGSIWIIDRPTVSKLNQAALKADTVEAALSAAGVPEVASSPAVQALLAASKARDSIQNRKIAVGVAESVQRLRVFRAVSFEEAYRSFVVFSQGLTKLKRVAARGSERAQDLAKRVERDLFSAPGSPGLQMATAVWERCRVTSQVSSTLMDWENLAAFTKDDRAALEAIRDAVLVPREASDSDNAVKSALETIQRLSTRLSLVCRVPDKAEEKSIVNTFKREWTAMLGVYKEWDATDASPENVDCFVFVKCLAAFLAAFKTPVFVSVEMGHSALLELVRETIDVAPGFETVSWSPECVGEALVERIVAAVKGSAPKRLPPAATQA